MKFLSFCPPFTRSRFGFRSCAVAFCTFVLLGSGEARADLTQQQIQAAFFNALMQFSAFSSGEDGVIVTLPYDGELIWALSDYLETHAAFPGIAVGSKAGDVLGRISAQVGQILAAEGASSNDLARISSFFPAPGDSQYTLAEFLSQIAGSASSVASSVSLLDFRTDSHGDELLVAAPDIESLLDDVYDLLSYNLGGMYDLLQYIYDYGLSVGQISVSNQVDVNVLNWPDYFTGQYDQQVAEEIASAPQYEDDWDSYVSDSDYSARQSEDDASEDSPYFADVTNAVGSVSLGTDSLSEDLPIRNEVFDPISSDLIPASVVNRNFSSDVLILRAVPQFHIPEIAWDGNDSAWQSFLSRSGSLMSALYDVFFALFVIWLVWREYNFYFRTM